MPKDKRGNKVHRMPNYKKAVIERNKLKNYLLNPSKSNGKHKFFNGLGYNMKNYKKLETDLRTGISKNEASVSITNKYGHTVKGYNVDMQLGIDSKAIVLTHWEAEGNSKIPRFITAYPAERGGKKK